MRDEEENAFPSSAQRDRDGDVITYADNGMSLHDWYVGQALIGLLSNSHVQMKFSERVESAFEVADLVMKLRERQR